MHPLPDDLPDDGAKIDALTPSQARVYDYFLGGKDNFAADRDLADRIQAEAGGWREAAGVNRRFILLATRWCAGVKEIGQFLDLGCGLPLKPSVHDAARRECPEAVVVYVDRDPMAISHVAALTAGPGIGAVRADAADPARVLEAAGDLEMPGGGRLFDLTRPACAIFGGTLSTMTADAARNAVRGYAAAMAPGSAVVISCLSYEDQEAGKRAESLYSAAGQWVNHSYQDVESFFLAADLQLVHGRTGDARRLSRDLAAEMLSRSAAVSRSSQVGPHPATCVLAGIGITGGAR